jgi:PKD repeat protein
VHPNPIVDFTINDSSQCLNHNLFSLNDTSSISSGSLSLFWDLGDSTSSTSANVSKTFAAANTYPIKLVATSNNGCKDSLTKSIIVHPNPIVDFTINDSSQCLNHNLFTLNDTSSISSGSLSLFWELGDSTSSTSANVSKAFAASNTYPIKLVATSNNGCKDSLTKGVIVHPDPTAIINAQTSTTFCVGESVTLNAIIETGNTYQWLNNNSRISGANTSQYTANIEGDYKIIASNSFGCSDTSTVIEVTVNSAPPPTPILGDSIVFVLSQQKYSIVKTPGSFYNWKVIGGTIMQNDSQTITLIWDNEGIGKVTLIETNKKGCPGDTNILTIRVLPIPDSLFINEDTLFFQPQASSQLIDILCNKNWTTTVSAPEWVSINPESGFGTQKPLVSVEFNDSKVMRYAQIAFFSGILKHSITIVQDASTGLDNQAWVQQVILYPNPTRGEFNLKNQSHTNLDFSLINIDGLEILPSKQLNASSLVSVRTELIPGIYFLKIRDEQQSVKILKLVIIK